MQNHAKNEAPEEEAGTRQGKNENVYVSNAWFNLTCYHTSPPLRATPRDKSSPLGLGVGGGVNQK